MVVQDTPLLPNYDWMVCLTGPGPWQTLLESLPCHACLQPITKETHSLVSDSCNNTYHLRCTSRQNIPSTYWYCVTCTRHIAAKGITEPAEDLPLQHYLQHGVAPQHLLTHFVALARQYRWRNNSMERNIYGVWRVYPSPGYRVLLLEEIHT